MKVTLLAGMVSRYFAPHALVTYILELTWLVMWVAYALRIVWLVATRKVHPSKGDYRALGAVLLAALIVGNLMGALNLPPDSLFAVAGAFILGLYLAFVPWQIRRARRDEDERKKLLSRSGALMMSIIACVIFVAAYVPAAAKSMPFSLIIYYVLALVVMGTTLALMPSVERRIERKKAEEESKSASDEASGAIPSQI